MAEIMLTRGFRALVDASDIELVLAHKWHTRKGGNTFYAYARPSLAMHRLILGLGEGDTRVADHINGNGLDNRRGNLRIATRAENGRYRARGRNNKSGYKGVHFDASKSQSKWRASIRNGGKNEHLGWHKTAEDAARAYNTAARLYFGEFAKLNEGV